MDAASSEEEALINHLKGKKRRDIKNYDIGRDTMSYECNNRAE